MESVDVEQHTATMRANGTDKRGQGGAKATIVSRLSAADGGTRVEIDTDYTITGRLARFGRGGMIEDISERLLREFASCLQASLGEQQDPAPRPTSAPLDAGALATSVVKERIRGNRAPLLFALAVGILVLLRRRRR
jgi:hypothetical protein